MLSIPDLAAEQIAEAQGRNDENSSTLFFVGNKSAGKTTLIYSFLDKNETPKETLVTDYCFGRKTIQKQGIEKFVCHVWEYGGNLEMLKTVLNSIPRGKKYTLCIMVDLSKVKRIWHVLETCLKTFMEEFKDTAIPTLVLVGSKYDVFKNFDTDVKKLVTTTLRSLALLFKAHLIFHSSKEPVLVKRTKEVFNNISFGDGFPARDKVTNFSKPLFVPAESDSWENIGTGSCTFEQIKLRHISSVPLESDIYLKESNKDTQPAVDTAFAEPYLDSLIAEKYNEQRSDISVPFSWTQ